MGAGLGRIGELASKTTKGEGVRRKLDESLDKIMRTVEKKLSQEELAQLQSRTTCADLEKAARTMLAAGLMRGDSKLTERQAMATAETALLSKAFAFKLYQLAESAVGSTSAFQARQRARGIDMSKPGRKMSLCELRIHSLRLGKTKQGLPVFSNAVCGNKDVEPLDVASYTEVKNMIDMFSTLECADGGRPLGKALDGDDALGNLGIKAFDEDDDEGEAETVAAVEMKLKNRLPRREEPDHPLCVIQPGKFDAGQLVRIRGDESREYSFIREAGGGENKYVLHRDGRDIEVAADQVIPAPSKSVPHTCTRVTGRMDNDAGKRLTMIARIVEGQRRKMEEAQESAAKVLVPLLDKYFPPISTQKENRRPAIEPTAEAAPNKQELPLAVESRSASESLVLAKTDENSQAGGRNWSLTTQKEMIADAVKAKDAIVEMMLTCDLLYRQALTELRALQAMEVFYGEATHNMQQTVRELDKKHRSRYMSNDDYTRGAKASYADARRRSLHGLGPCPLARTPAKSQPREREVRRMADGRISIKSRDITQYQIGRYYNDGRVRGVIVDKERDSSGYGNGGTIVVQSGLPWLGSMPALDSISES